MGGHILNPVNGGDSPHPDTTGAAGGSGEASARWSADAMIERLGGDEELARQLVALFLVEYPKLLAALNDSLVTGNPDTVRRAAHAAKGCIANFVDGGPQATAYAIERLGAAGRLDEAAPLVARLEREVAAMAGPMADFERAGTA